MTDVGVAYVSVLPSAKGFGNKLSTELSGGAAKAGRDAGKRAGEGVHEGIAAPLKRIGAVFAGAFVADKAVGFFKGAIAGASDLNESLSKVGVVFGKNSGIVTKFARTSAKAMGLSTQAALEAAGTFGNLFVALKLPQKASATMSTSLVKLAGDLASFNNVDPAEALDALRSGLTGETEPLKRFGVNMNDATLHAQALKLGLISNIKDALTPAAKAQAAYSLILAQTTTAQGDFTRTSGGLANQQRIMAAQWADLKAKIGAGFLPIAVKVAQFFTGSLIPAIGKVGDIVGPVFASLVGAFKVFFSFVKGNDTGVDGPFRTMAVAGQKVHDLLGKIRTSFGRVRDALGGVGDSAKILVGKIQAALDDFVPDVSRLAADIASGLAATGGTIIEGVKTGLDKGDWKPLGKSIGDALLKTIQGGANIIGKVGKTLGDLLGKVDWVGVGISIGKQAPSLLIGVAAGFLNFDIMGLLKGLAAHWQDVILAILTIAFTPAKILGKVGELLARIPLFGKLLAWAFEHFVKFSKGLIGLVGDALKAMGGAFLRGLLGEQPRVVGALRQFVTNIVTFLFVHADDFLKGGANLIRRLGDGILRAMEGLGSVVRGALSRLGGWLRSGLDLAVSGALRLLRDRWNAITDVLGAPLRAAVRVVSRAFDSIAGVVRIMPSRVRSAARGMFDGIKEAFRSAINFLIRGWNRLHFRLPSFDTHIPGVGKVGGFDIGVPPITPLALGGIVTRPTLTLTGEAGPEAVIPLSKLRSVLDLPVQPSGQSGGPLFRDINVVSAPGERAEHSVPRAMRDRVFLAGIGLARA